LTLLLPYEITVEYSEPILRLAARRFFWRFIRRDLVFGFSLLLIDIAVWLTLEDWKQPLGLLLLALVVIFLPVFMARRYIRSAMARARMLKNPVGIWRFSAETFAARSDSGSGEMRWEHINQIWQYPEVWLLFFGDYQYSVLPVANFPPELQEFIVERVRARGGKIS
jgi:hypothetical protein